MLLESAANLITAIVSKMKDGEVVNTAIINRIIELGLKSRKDLVQVAASQAIGAVSRVRDCDTEIKR